MLIAAQEQGLDADRLAHSILELHWRDDADISDRTRLEGLAESLGIEVDLLIARAGSSEVRDRYAENTAEALKRSVFGSPTYFLDGDMFYGQDHLELIERALSDKKRRRKSVLLLLVYGLSRPEFFDQAFDLATQDVRLT